MLHSSLAVVLATALAMPVAYAPPPAAPGGEPAVENMTDAQRLEKAKSLYGEADAAFNNEDYTNALRMFEEAYNVYAPQLHLFNVNIGLAAHALGDCVKAKTAFQRFLDLVPDNPARSTAQEKLLEIERTKCAEQQAAAAQPAPAATGPTLGSGGSDDDDAPVLTSKRSQRDDAIEDEKRITKQNKTSPLLIAGAVTLGLGGAALIGGFISLGLAKKKADDLAGEASPGTTGFPEGDYSDDDTFQLDRNRLPTNNRATVALLVLGGVLAATGTALIVVDRVRAKKAGAGSKKNARRNRPHIVGVSPAVLPGGGGAAAAIRF